MAHRASEARTSLSLATIHYLPGLSGNRPSRRTRHPHQPGPATGNWPFREGLEVTKMGCGPRSRPGHSTTMNREESTMRFFLPPVCFRRALCSSALSRGPPRMRRSNTTATSGRSWPRTASPATGRTAPRARPTCGSISARRRSRSGAIVPGKPDESELVARIISDDPEEVMPPPTTQQDADGRAEGAAQALDRGRGRVSAALVVHRAGAARRCRRCKNAAWVRNPIDRLRPGASWKQQGLQPAAEADRRTLARRAEPRPDRPAARRRPRSRRSSTTRRPTPTRSCVDRLLASPHWGEHRGRYWLDAARYADTHGIHFDNYREMWAYRDWVIGAFNRNLPFDQFTIEQLAGDLLPNRTLDQQIASGFNRCNITTNEGGAIAEEYLVLYTRDRTETDVAGLAGPDGRLRGLPRPQVRPAHAARVLRAGGVLQQHDAGGDGRQHQGHAADRRRAAAAEDRQRWDAADDEAGRRSRSRSTPASSRPGPSSTTGWRRPRRPTIAEPGARRRACICTRRSSEGDGQRDARRRSTASRATVALAGGVSWAAGHVARARRFKTQPGAALEVADAGDFEKDQPFSCGAWVKLPPNDLTGAICRPHGRRQRLPRLGPLGRERPASARTSSTSGRTTR